MTRCGQPPDKGGMTLGNPTQDEEGAACTMLIEQIEELAHPDVKARWDALPAGAGHVGREGGDLKVFLDVDREMVTKRLPSMRHVDSRLVAALDQAIGRRTYV